VGTYLGRLEQAVAARGITGFRVMTSSGGTLRPAQAAQRAASLALSGPAGGVVGAQLVGRALGLAELLTLDMGGTSADASLVTEGAPVSEGGGAVAGIPLALPAVVIETVSAGGGSIARLDAGGALKVGPESAGAAPGPACYARGGTEPTVTDACLVLGWLDPASPLADGVRLDRDRATRALDSLALPARGAGAAIAVAAGIVAVAVAVMARALKSVSVARGLDPRRMALVAFGGAGPLFACQLADALGMGTVVIPPHPGVLSALGLAAAAQRVDLVASLHRPLEALQATEIGRAFSPLLAQAAAQVPGGAAWRYADCRFAGQGYEVTIPVTTNDPQRIGRAFHTAHQARYGHAGNGQPVELVNLRVVVVGEQAAPRFDAPGRGATAALAHRPITLGGERVTAAVWPLDGLEAGVTIDGPAVLVGQDATALVAPGWRGTTHPSGAVLVSRR
jgi:N-methylhydantoinase A